MMELLKKNKRCIHDFKTHDWTNLAKLLKQGISIKEATVFMDDHSKIPSLLEQGMTIEHILCADQQGVFYTHLRFFLSIASLADAIMSALDMEAFEKNMMKALKKQIAYPLFILIFSFLILYLFSSMVLPQLMSSFDLKQENEALMFTVVLLEQTVNVCCLFAVAVLLLTLAAKKNDSIRFWIYKRMKWTNVPKDMISYRIAGYFIQLIHHGIATKDAFSFLSQFKDGSLIAHCAKQMKIELEQGKELLEILKHNDWINDSFYHTWRIGIHTKDMKEALVQMMRRQEAAWSHQIKTITILIQVFAYGFVGILVLIMYQIMLIPLQLMETL